MNFPKVLIHLLIFLLLLLMMFVVLPILVSMNDWEPVVLGVILTISTIVGAVYWGLSLGKEIKKLMEEM